MSNRSFYCSALLSASFLFLTATSASSAASKTIDGFTVSISTKVSQLPKVADLPSPSSTTGTVLVYTGDIGAPVGGVCASDPFSLSPTLAGVSPYFAIQENSSATFVFQTSRLVLTLLWGTPDWFNTITFYDVNNNVVGTLTGADFQTAYGITETFRPLPYGAEDYTKITSPLAFKKVVLTSTGCAFEFSNLSAR